MPIPVDKIAKNVNSDRVGVVGTVPSLDSYVQNRAHFASGRMN